MDEPESREDGQTTVRVIGTFRCGTNLMKYLLEENFDCQCVFSDAWWKHMPIPALGGRRWYNIPTVVMVREPFQQLVSWFQYSQRFPAEIKGGETFKEFLRSDFFIGRFGGKEQTALMYYYPTPMAYWNQFYFAAQAFDRLYRLKIQFQAYGELQEETVSAMTRIGEAFDLQRRKKTWQGPPDKKLRKAWDRMPEEKSMLLEKSFKPQDAYYDLAAYYDADDVAVVLKQMLPEVMAPLNLRLPYGETEAAPAR